MAALSFAHHILLSKPSFFLHSSKTLTKTNTFFSISISSPFIRRHKSTQTIASSLLELGGVQISKQDVVKDEPTNNVPDLIFTKLGLQLHRRDNHPLGILKNAIYEYFDSNYNNQFLKFDDLCPIVTTKQVGLLGEKLSLYTDEGSSNVSWNQYTTPSTLTWYKTTFDTPEGNNPIALNLGSMGKGEAWINGQSIGRYWVSFKTASGSPSQTWYNVPRYFLKPTRNLLVLFEEEYGNPLKISLDSISVNKVCGRVTDFHPSRINSWGARGRFHWRSWPRIRLRCPKKRTISRIVFASHGNPSGDCGSYSIGNCHSSNSKQIVENACLGRRQCSISHTTRTFGGGPCPGTPKTLLVDARCE